jgi:CYTH domain-containing protein
VGADSVHLNMTIRHPETNGQRVETRRNLTPREYEALRSQSDPTRTPITKLRRCFLYNDCYFQIDVFQSPSPGLVLLEAYLEKHNTEDPHVMQQCLPPWLDLIRVTDQPDFSMYSMAAKRATSQELLVHAESVASLQNNQ